MTTTANKMKSYSSKQLLSILDKKDDRYETALEILIKRGVVEEPKIEEPKTEEPKKEAKDLTKLEEIKNIWKAKKGTTATFNPNPNSKSKEEELTGKITGAIIDKRKMVVYVRLTVDGILYHKVTNAVSII